MCAWQPALVPGGTQTRFEGRLFHSAGLHRVCRCMFTPPTLTLLPAGTVTKANPRSCLIGRRLIDFVMGNHMFL